MEGLDEFEKQLAAEKAEREREEKKVRKHRPRDRDHDDSSERRHRDKDEDRHRQRHHHRSRAHDEDRDGHRHKRSRHSKDDEDHHRRRRDADDPRQTLDLDSTDPKEKLPLPDEEATPMKEKTVRDAWMTAPSGIDIDFVHRPDKTSKAPPPKEEPKRAIHKRELNASYLDELNNGDLGAVFGVSTGRKVEYKFGDEGSKWRMTKLKAVYTTAEQTGRTVDEVALERYGSLEDFDDAREEKDELDRKHVYGRGFVGKGQPTGELYRERMSHQQNEATQRARDSSEEIEQSVVMPEENSSSGAVLTQTELNRLKAELMKAKIRRAPNAEKLEEEYNQALANFTKNGPPTKILNAMENRMLEGTRGEVKRVETKRGKERGTVEQNDEMTVEDMVREERRTRGQAGGEGMRLAERIAKDGKFDNDLEYMDENAEKLAKRVHKSEINLKNMAVNEYQKMQRVLDNCPLCHQEDKNQPPLAPVVSLGTRAYITLPTEPEIGEGGAVIVPITHRRNLLECDDDEWEEIRNFMKSLTRMYHEQGREVVFYENAAAPNRHLHAAMMAVAIPYDEGATAPAYFKEAFLTADDEWSQHKKIIDTGAKARDGMGRMAFRRSIAKEMPYFHVWFSLDGGLGHIVENSERWPKGDLFAREILGGMMDVAPDVVKRQGRWRKGDQRVEGFKKRWRKFDWTRVLTEG
jgi:hypothetical protein